MIVLCYKNKACSLHVKYTIILFSDIPLIFTSEAINNCSLPFWADYRGGALILGKMIIT